MTSTMTTLDRRLRGFLVAPAALALGVLVGPASVAAVVFYAVAAIMLVTAAAGHCPLYSLSRIAGRGRALRH
jgi:uncharacterized membrane protein YphA (DoxX/SURF4 family)